MHLENSSDARLIEICHYRSPQECTSRRTYFH